jgi:uncharacterized protein YacL
MSEKPKIIYLLVLLWLALSAIFILWGWYSLSFILRIQSPGWEQWLAELTPQVHLGYLISTIVWFVFSALFILFAYGTFRKEHWVWTTGLIISTIFLVVFGLMLGAFMVNAVVYLDWFSVAGLITVILTFIIDIGIVFFLTRPDFKLYFGIA